jgi:hypothetical protein
MLFNIPVGGKRSTVVSVYGAASETVTITDEKGTIYTATTDDTGYGGELEIKFGNYTVAGSVSGYSGSVTVDKTTTIINAWPANDAIYFWHGAAPAGAWSGDDYVAGSYVTELSKWSTENGKLYVEAYSKYSNAIIGTASAVDLTGIDQLHFAVDSCNANNTYFVVSPTKDLSQKVIEYRDPNGSNHIVSLDVSALTGFYYIAFYVHVYDYLTTRTCTVSRVWGTVDPTGTIRSTKQEIAIGNTYRYANSLIAGDWVKVSSLRFGSIHYFGQGTEDYNAMMVPVKAFNYSGSFERLWLALYLWTSDKSNHTFRWAVTTSTANAEAYKLGVGDVEDAYQLAQGVWTPPYSDAFQWFTIGLDVENIPSGTPFYIYLWRDNTTYGNIHVTSSAVVTLNYAKS